MGILLVTNVLPTGPHFPAFGENLQPIMEHIHDFESPVYELTDEYDGHKVVPKNFFMLAEAYQNHPEAKSLAADGGPCEFDTRGLLQRAHVIANWPPVYIGKESDRHWEEGEDLSLLDFSSIVYKRKGYAVATDEQLARIEKVPKREFIRRRINQHTLEKICNREPVRAKKLAKCLKVLQQWESEDEDSSSSPSRGARLHRAEAEVVEDSHRVIRSQLKATLDRGC